MIEGAVFDLDGTLLDSMGMWDTLLSDILRSAGVEPDPDLTETVAAMSLAEAAEYCRCTYALPFSAKRIVTESLQKVDRFYHLQAKPMPCVERLLSALQKENVRMCVATASDRALAAQALQHCGLISYFSDILDCSEVGCGKNKPDIYREALRRLGTPKEKTVVFEDALHAVQTAKADGFFTVALYSRFEKDTACLRRTADVVLHSWAQTDTLLPILRTL